MSDNIFFQGPKKDVEPTPGGNPETFRDIKTNPYLGRTSYADLTLLQDLLDKVRLETSVAAGFMNNELTSKALPIPSDDTKLIQAQEEEWPRKVGDMKRWIPYNQYKALESKQTVSATYIRDRWEAVARDVGGPTSFDYVKPVELIRKEVDLIENFVSSYVGDVDDSSEERTVELFQDWATDALSLSKSFRSTWEYNRANKGVSTSELDQIQPDDLSKYQSLLKVKLNKLNQEIGQAYATLKKSYFDTSEAFYSRFLGPALSFRLNVTRKVTQPSAFTTEIGTIASSLDRNFESHLTDLLHRNQSFREKLTEYCAMLNNRDRVRGYVEQLDTRTQQYANKLKIDAITDDVDPDDWFDTELEGATPNLYRPSHSKLTDRDDPDAHPSLLSRFGGMIEGDIEVKDGITIDGVDLSEHGHTGEDGTVKIQGKDIENLVSSQIDRSEEVGTPVDLHLVKRSDDISGSSDVEIAWTGDEQFVYEVQVVAIGQEAGANNVPIEIVSDVDSVDGVSVGVLSRMSTYNGEVFHISSNLTVPGITSGRNGIVRASTSGGLSLLWKNSSPDGNLAFMDSVTVANGDVYAIIGDSSEPGGISTLFRYNNTTDAFEFYTNLPEGYSAWAVSYDFNSDIMYVICVKDTDNTDILLRAIDLTGTADPADTALDTDNHIPYWASAYAINEYVYCIALDMDVYDPDNGSLPAFTISRISLDTNTFEVLTTWDELAAQLNGGQIFPLGMVVTRNEILLNGLVFRISPAGIWESIVSLDLDGQDAVEVTEESGLAQPVGLCMSNRGDVYSLDFNAHIIYRIFPSGNSGAR